MRPPSGHRIYLFEMRDGRNKVSWGRDPADALETLRLRLGPEEMAEILPDCWTRVSQRDLAEWAHTLG